MPFTDEQVKPVPQPHPIDVRNVNPDLITYLESKWGLNPENELEVIHAVLSLIYDAVFGGRTPLAVVSDTADSMVKEV